MYSLPCLEQIKNIHFCSTLVTQVDPVLSSFNQGSVFYWTLLTWGRLLISCPLTQAVIFICPYNLLFYFILLIFLFFYVCVLPCLFVQPCVSCVTAILLFVSYYLHPLFFIDHIHLWCCTFFYCCLFINLFNYTVYLIPAVSILLIYTFIYLFTIFCSGAFHVSVLVWVHTVERCHENKLAMHLETGI